MPINLKPVEVALVGLGATGGVAVLPLTRAGLRVKGLEAGTWMQHGQFRPDEIHTNVCALVTLDPRPGARFQRSARVPISAPDLP